MLALLQVDPDAFAALEACVAEGTYETCEEVPAGDDNGFLIQPIGGNAVDMIGPARYYSVCSAAPIVICVKCLGTPGCWIPQRPSHIGAW